MRLPSTWLLLLLISLLLVSACGKTYTPKPKGYPRFDLQKPIYSKLPLDVPYTFNVNNTAKVMLDTSKYAEPFWIDIKYPQFDASVQLTYKHLDKDLGSLNGLVEDCRKLVSKHQVKASSIEEYTLKTANGNTAYCFQLAGQVPTQFQFYTTDSSKHFLRGALYFNTSLANDSLSPAIKYITADMVELLKTLNYKGN